MKKENKSKLINFNGEQKFSLLLSFLSFVALEKKSNFFPKTLH